MRMELRTIIKLIFHQDWLQMNPCLKRSIRVFGILQSNLLQKECQFPNTTAEEILMRLQYQVREFLGIMETNMNWPASKGPRDDQLLVQELENILVMEDKLYNIISYPSGKRSPGIFTAMVRILVVIKD